MRKPWPFKAFLPSIIVLDGLELVRGPGWESGPVVAHYRGRAPLETPHVYVFSDGTYEVNHADTFNPEVPHLALPHFVFDLLLKKFLLNR
jgi:hypothetical protein